MSWLFKRDDGKYLHSFRVGYYGKIEAQVWDSEQCVAFRFEDRNAASSVARATGEAGRIITLTPGGINKRLDALEASQTRTKTLLDASFEALGKVVSGLLPREKP